MKLASGIKTQWRDWQQFWFAPMDLYNAGLFRMLFGGTLLVMYIQRFSEWKYFFTNQGMLPLAHWENVVTILGRMTSHPFFAHSDSGIHIQAIVHLVLLVLFTTGLAGRLLTGVLFLVNLGLIQRNWMIAYGADLFANFWLFYLTFVRHNQYFSLWNFLKKGRRRIERKEASGDILSTMGLRLIQIQLCISYAYTGVEKFKGTSWWEGSAVWRVVGMDDLVPKDFSFLYHYPLLVAALSMGTVVFEVYFCFAVWHARWRWPWLLVGFLFHLSTALFMDLWYFFLVMTTPYLLFLPRLYRRAATVDFSDSNRKLTSFEDEEDNVALKHEDNVALKHKEEIV